MLEFSSTERYVDASVTYSALPSFRKDSDNPDKPTIVTHSALRAGEQGQDLHLGKQAHGTLNSFMGRDGVGGSCGVSGGVGVGLGRDGGSGRSSGWKPTLRHKPFTAQ